MTCKVLLHHYGRFTSPPRRSFVGGLVATVDPVELEKISTIQVKRILTYSLGYDENSATFLYLRKPNCSLDSSLVPLADALQDRNMLLTYAQSHQNRLHVYVSRVDDPSDSHHMITYLTRKISRRFTTLYYTLPPNNTLSGLKQIKNDYDTNVMYDIARVAGKIQLFVSHHSNRSNTVLIPNDGSLEEAFADFPYGKKAIRTKWVYRNKKIERGVMVRNKARLVAQGHRQEEGIDYDEVYVSQPPGFVDPKYPKKLSRLQKRAKVTSEKMAGGLPEEVVAA
ncbi:oligopeptide transporter [Tanacetum coccineum]